MLVPPGLFEGVVVDMSRIVKVRGDVVLISFLIVEHFFDNGKA